MQISVGDTVTYVVPRELHGMFCGWVEQDGVKLAKFDISSAGWIAKPPFFVKPEDVVSPDPATLVLYQEGKFKARYTLKAKVVQTYGPDSDVCDTVRLDELDRTFPARSLTPIKYITAVES